MHGLLHRIRLWIWKRRGITFHALDLSSEPTPEEQRRGRQAIVQAYEAQIAEAWRKGQRRKAARLERQLAELPDVGA